MWLPVEHTFLFVLSSAAVSEVRALLYVIIVLLDALAKYCTKMMLLFTLPLREKIWFKQP